MRLIITLSATLVTLLVGFTTWNLLPDNQVFSWIESSGNEYLIGSPSSTADRDSASFLGMTQYEAAIADLRSTVTGNYHVYASVGVLGQRLEVESDVSFPIFRQDYVSLEYFPARNLTLRAGRLFHSNEPDAYVLGADLAREMFGRAEDAVGRHVRLYSNQPGQLDRQVEIVGVLEPSPAQDPDHDPDSALVGNLSGLLERSSLYERVPLHLFMVLPHDEGAAEMSEVQAWSSGFMGAQAQVQQINALVDRRASTIESLNPRIGARRIIMLGFGLVISIAALLALYAHAFWRLLRRLQLLGIDKALGAPTGRLIRTMVLENVPWCVLGSAVGIAVIFQWHVWFPTVFLTTPPLIVLAVASLVPLVALSALAALVSRSLVTAAPMELIRGKVQGARVRPLMAMVYVGLALALAGGLAAFTVERLVEAEVAALESQYGFLLSLQAGNPVLDPRSEQAFESGEFRPVFTPQDAAELRSLRSVEGAALAQAIPNMEILTSHGRTTAMAMAADASYMGLMGLILAEGDSSGCVMTPGLATRLDTTIGDTVQLEGVSDKIDCRLTGILAPPAPLSDWLIEDLPELIAPPIDGLGLALPGYEGDTFASTRILLRPTRNSEGQDVLQWLEDTHPALKAELVPTAPKAADLLFNLAAQAQLFSLMSAFALTLSVWAIIGGFWALLDAERFKIALDRALGQTVGAIAKRWWQQLTYLGIASLTVGAVLGHFASIALYDALALDIPNLPLSNPQRLDPVAVIGASFLIIALSSLLSVAGHRWLTSRSTLELLKEGSI